jgi:hypothetical protein
MLDAYTAPREIGGLALRVILADGSNERINNFRLTSSGSEGFHFRVCRTEASLQSTLNEPRSWDLVLHSCFLGDWKQPASSFAPTLEVAFLSKRIRGVVCISPIETDARRFIEALRAKGIPCTYVPFTYQNPKLHNQLKFPDLKYVL